MEGDHFFESFIFCSRDELECLQLVRRSLRKTIAGRSKALSLRSIHRVNVDCFDPLGTIQIFVDDDRYNEFLIPDYETSFRDGDFAEAVRRLQNACIKHFNVGISDSPFLRFWKAQEAAVAFTVLSIEFDPPKSTTDYDALDSIMHLLRPRTVDVSFENGPPTWMDETAAYDSEYLPLLVRDSFRNNLQICPLNIWRDPFPLPSFILNEPGYPNYELRCRHRNHHHRSVADGIDAFIESFKRDGCANRKLESVWIWWTEYPKAAPPSPMPKLLSEPTKIDKPLPTAEAKKTMWSTRGVHRVSQCEMHSFLSEKQSKRMDVYKWIVETDDRAGHDNPFGLWTTHVLQCQVKNL